MEAIKKSMAEKKTTEKKLSSLATAVLVKPRITEKAYALNALNQYAFQVIPAATKGAVKQAIEEAYGVTVVAVNMVKLPGKTRVFGRVKGKRQAIKKALVTLKKGDSITLFKAGI